MPVDVQPLVAEWMADDKVVQLAAIYKLMNYELGISAEAAESHAIIIGPIMKHLGFLVAVLICFKLYSVS